MKEFLRKFRGQLEQNKSLAEYTSWKIGGPAEYFYEPADLEDLVDFLKHWEKEPITILGAGTNVLISDRGIKGLVIYLRSCLNKIIELDDFVLHVEAGVSLPKLVSKCVTLEMIDAAFMAGIPGTLGGALAMNAGAYGDCIWNHVLAVETINIAGEINSRQAKEFIATYREVTGLQKNEWFVAAKLKFAHGDAEKTKEKINEYLQQRKKTQPLNLPNCGSVFRNPKGDYAARLIEASSLKGRQIGGAKISEKHANFIVNCNNATAEDVMALIQEIIITVEKDHKIRLVPEVCVLGEV